MRVTASLAVLSSLLATVAVAAPSTSAENELHARTGNGGHSWFAGYQNSYNNHKNNGGGHDKGYDKPGKNNGGGYSPPGNHNSGGYNPPGNNHGGGYSPPGNKCSKNQFWYDDDCCDKGGPPDHPRPPSGVDCPRSWYWKTKKGKCYPEQPDQPTPTCGSGWKWDGPRKCCSKYNPPKPTPTPPNPPKPSQKPDGGHGGHGGGGGGKGYGWKSRRDVVEWDESFCPSGLKTCPVALGGVLSHEAECIDIQTDIFSCGGCASLNEGQDCSRIPHATSSTCMDGACFVEACAAGYRPARDDKSCVPA